MEPKNLKKLLVHFEKLGIRFPVPGREEIYVFSETSRRALGHTQPRVQWVPVVHSPGRKRMDHESDHSLQSTAAVTMNGTVAGFLPVCRFDVLCLLVFIQFVKLRR